MAADLWAVRLERPLTEEEMLLLTDLLPAQRRLRLERTPMEKRREPLCAYALLRRALREQYGLTDLPSIAFGPLGKPVFRERTDIYFSISHTGGAVLVGLSDAPIGVDIQAHQPVGNALLRHFGMETPDAFFRSWVRREARAKRAGTPVELRAESSLAPEEGYWPLVTFPGFFAGVSAARGEEPVLRTLDMERLLE